MEDYRIILVAICLFGWFIPCIYLMYQCGAFDKEEKLNKTRAKEQH